MSAVAEGKKKRGRPAGSKNKPKALDAVMAATPQEVIAQAYGLDRLAELAPDPAAEFMASMLPAELPAASEYIYAGDLPSLSADASPEAMWRNAFGDDYHTRNRPDWRARIPFWRRLIDEYSPHTFLDIGCGPGWNLFAIKEINSEFEMSGVDLNQQAIQEAQMAGFDVVESAAGKVADIFGHGVADFVITSGVLIHIPPDELRQVMQACIDVSRQYVICIEYFSDTEEMVPYRNNLDRLWKRPYAKLYQEMGLNLVEWGEAAEGFDHCQWAILEKLA